MSHSPARPMEFDDGTAIQADGVVDELNTCLKWVSYPGRTSTTATTEELDFARP